MMIVSFLTRLLGRISVAIGIGLPTGYPSHGIPLIEFKGSSSMCFRPVILLRYSRYIQSLDPSLVMVIVESTWVQLEVLIGQGSAPSINILYYKRFCQGS